MPAVEASTPRRAIATLPIFPQLTFSVKTRSVGRFVYVSYKVVNDGVIDLQNAAVRMGLPDYNRLYVRDASVFPSPRGMRQVNVEDAVYWLNVTVPAKRSRRFTLKLKALGCGKTELDFQSFMYFVSQNGTSFDPTGQSQALVSAE